MERNKGFNVVFLVIFTLVVFLGNFCLPVFAFDNKSVDSGQAKAKATPLPSMTSAVLNKLNFTPYPTSAISQDLSIIKKETSGLENSKTTEKKYKKYVDGEVLVKYKNTKININTISGRDAASNFTNSKSLEKKEDIKRNNISVLKIKDKKTVEQKILDLKNDPNVEYAQPNYQYYPTDFANDTYADSLWGLNNFGQTVNGVAGKLGADIEAVNAWNINEGTSSSAIVAVIDSGVAYNHPDLVDNMWNGISCVGDDKSGNPINGGCQHGFDYQDNDKIPLPTIYSHGTHVAGTIASVKNNNKGIIGVAPKAKIMAIKMDGTTSQVIKSINFAQQNGATIINFSWGESFNYGAYSHYYLDQSLYDAIANFPGLFIASAGNSTQNHDSGEKRGQVPFCI